MLPIDVVFAAGVLLEFLVRLTGLVELRIFDKRFNADVGPSYFCLNDGQGGFRSPCTAIPIGSATSVVPADFNNDGFIDLAVPDGESRSRWSLYGDLRLCPQDGFRR